jgi:hypothetical protein
VLRLLDTGANPNAMDRCGYTPLHAANTPEIVDLLLNTEADINHPNQLGDTPLRIAVADRHPKLECIKALLRQGADKDIQDAKGKTSLEAVQDAIEFGVVDSSRSTSTKIDNNARKVYAEVLELFFFPKHLW